MGRKGQIPWNKGMKMSKEYRKNLSIAHMGQKAWNKGLRTKPPKPKRVKLSKEELEFRKVVNQIHYPSFRKRKESKEVLYARTLKYIRKNRKKVNARAYARDHNQKADKCLWCSSTKQLHFHHTNYELKRGYTLCKVCHNLERRGMMLNGII